MEGEPCPNAGGLEMQTFWLQIPLSFIGSVVPLLLPVSYVRGADSLGVRLNGRGMPLCRGCLANVQ